MEEEPYEELPGLCKHCTFSGKGRKQSDLCKFHHTERICKYYLNGNCEKAEKCSFVHCGKQSGDPPTHKRNKSVMCKYYAKGYCRNGDKCQYTHDELSSFVAFHNGASFPSLKELSEDEVSRTIDIFMSDEDSDLEEGQIEDSEEEEEEYILTVPNGESYKGQRKEKKSSGGESRHERKRRRRRRRTRGAEPLQIVNVPEFGPTGKEGEKKLTIVLISDTHMKHWEIGGKLPQGPDDHILVHAGDFTQYGRKEHYIDFNLWLGSLHYKHIFVVGGNHERLCGNVRQHQLIQELLTNATYVTQDYLLLEEFGGLSLFLSSWEKKAFRGGHSVEPELFPWEEEPPESLKKLKKARGKERFVDIAVTHMPPKGIIDRGRGSFTLLNRIKEMRPAVHVFGHAHKRGVEQHRDTMYINAATRTRRGGPVVVEYFYI